jgi:hypothetical protein
MRRLPSFDRSRIDGSRRPKQYYAGRFSPDAAVLKEGSRCSHTETETLITAIPEPTSITLLGSGLIAVAMLRRRQRRE